MFDLGVVLVIYGALRTREKYREKYEESIKSRPIKLLRESSDELQYIPLEQRSLTDALASDKEKHQDLHYIKASIVSVGLSILRGFYAPVTILSIGMFTYIAVPYLRQIETSLLKNKKVDGYVLYGIADFMTLGLNRYATASFGICLVHTAKFIVSNAQDKSKKMLIDVFAQQPSQIWIIKDGAEVEIPLEDLHEDDTVVVTTGEVIPADGTVIHGVAMVDQRALTGESQPAEKEIGSLVFASTVLITGHIHVKVGKSGQETTIAKIGKILNNSVNYKTDSQLRGEKWADSWNLPVLGLAFLSWPILGPAGTVVILNGHIAQIIRIVAPLGTLNHLNIASHKGILIKTGHVLEEFSQIDTIIFDKTGTLTSEQPKVGRIILAPGSHYKEGQILAWAAAAERKLAHPIAHAIIEKADQCDLLLPEIADSEFHIGYGITVKIDGHVVRVGSQRFMEVENIVIPELLQAELVNSHEDGHSIIMVAIDGQVAGALEMHATVRPEVKKLIHNLRRRGIKHLAIVSGDHQNPTRKLAEELDMDDYFYDVLPENKAKIVESLKSQNRSVCFIGDGVNDAIAMKTADISISLSGATSIATDVADIVLMDGTLNHLPDLFDISDSLEKNLQNSLIINIIPGMTTIACAFLFRIDILVSMLISQVGLLVGVGNAMLPLKQLNAEEDALSLTQTHRHQHFEQLRNEQIQKGAQHNV